jgi:surface antigen
MIGSMLGVSAPAEALQCVPFAREVSGISIRGDAWTWWNAAEGQYDRGHTPRIGAVVVFKKFAAMRYGHVAVVARVVNSREVLVDHANWAPHRGRGRGQVSKMVAVTDVSPRNDWTEVRVWNVSTSDFGTRTYPTYGFIYPATSRGFIQQAVVNSSQEEIAGATHRRLSPPGDPVLATADRQIAAVLADDCVAVSMPADAYAAVAKPPANLPELKASASLSAEVKTADTAAVVGPVTGVTKIVEPMPAEPKLVEAKVAEPKAVEAKVAEPKPVEAKIAEAKPVEAKIVVVAVNDVKPTMAAATGRPGAAVNDGVWEGDLAAAKKVGSGRY